MRSGDHRLAVVATAVICLAAFAPAGAVAAAEHSKITPAQHAFAVAYEKLVPSLNKANAAVIKVVNNAGNKTASQIGTEFAALARQWDGAIKPLFSLHAPAPEATPFAAIEQAAKRIGTDLSGIAAGGSSNNLAATKKATNNLVSDNHALAAAGTALHKLLSQVLG